MFSYGLGHRLGKGKPSFVGYGTSEDPPRYSGGLMIITPVIIGDDGRNNVNIISLILIFSKLVLMHHLHELI